MRYFIPVAAVFHEEKPVFFILDGKFNKVVKLDHIGMS